MGRVFSKPKSRVTEQDRAVLQLKQQRDKLKQYQKRLDAQLDKDRDMARHLLKDGKKERAKLLLRKKRFLEQQLDRADGMLENIEKLTHDIEFKQVELKVLDGLKAGNAALNKLNAIFSIDEIEQIMDETKEGIDKQKEIDELLQGNLTAEDEEAALEELNELIASTETQGLDKLELPDVPMEELPDVEEKKKERVKRARMSEKVALTAS